MHYPEHTLADCLKAREEVKAQGNWHPASGGKEEPFTTRNNRRLLYCWQPSSGKHAYLDLDTDLILDDEEARLALGM
jgi:hypothetical protein